MVSHGGLARAGKVKGYWGAKATKAQKEVFGERRKKPNGRAKKRKQWNLRRAKSLMKPSILTNDVTDAGIHKKSSAKLWILPDETKGRKMFIADRIEDPKYYYGHAHTWSKLSRLEKAIQKCRSDSIQERCKHDFGHFGNLFAN